jgi:tetratricopeptide (TPR) repeat protein
MAVSGGLAAEEPGLPGGEGGGDARKALVTKADDLLAMMEVYADAKRWPSAIAKGRDARNLYLEAGMKRTAARVQNRVGALCLEAGRHNEARGELESALALEKESGDRVGACLTLSLLARVGLEGPVPEEGLKRLFEAYGIVRTDNLRGPFFLLTAASKEFRERLSAKRPVPASYFALLEKEIEFQLAMGWPNHAEALYFEKIGAYRADKRFPEAARACKELFAFNEKRKYRYGVAAAAHNLGLVLAADERLGDARFTRADEAYATAERMRREIGDFANLAWTLNNRGHLFIEKKRYQEAKPLLEEAYRLFGAQYVQHGERTALSNLLRLGREAGLARVAKSAENGLRALQRKPVVEPKAFEFIPKKTHRAYYIFLREDDLAPVIRLEGEESVLRFIVASTGERFAVPVATVTFRLTGGRSVGYGKRFLFLGSGAEAWADREGNLHLGEVPSNAGARWEFDPKEEAYPKTDTPVLALKTFVESINRGEWAVFQEAVSRFALKNIGEDSFRPTADKHKILPLGISVEGGELRNPSWAEIRYIYRPLYERGLKGVPPEKREERKKRMEAAFGRDYEGKRYRAFLVRVAKGWRLDFFEME